MIRELIFLNILLIFTSSVNATYNDRASSSGTRIKKNLSKCCPMETSVGRMKKCSNSNIILTVSNIKIYDTDINLTGKSFEDLFTLIPNKFENETLRRQLLDAIALEYRVYLMESGNIMLELPNTYNRWTEILPDRYCIDVDYRQGSEPRFWAITPTDEKVFSGSNRYLTIATVVSCFFMLLVLVVYLMLPELQNLGGLILMAYLFSLFMAFSLLVVMQIPDLFKAAACIHFSSVVYFFFLAVFCWMSVMSYDIWSTLRSTFKTRRRRGDHSKFLIYCLYAWGVPLLMTIFMVVVNTNRDNMKSVPWFITPRIPENGCFLQGGVKLLYFYIPMLILIISNWIFFLMTAFHIRQSQAGTAVLNSEAAGHRQANLDENQTLMVYLKLSVVMGLSWLLEIISFVYQSNDTMWLLPDTYNSLIGLAMFLIFVCKKNILKKLSKRCGVRKIMRWSSKTTEHSKIDSSQDDVALQQRLSSQPNGLYSTADELKENTPRR